mmetsp:Transcript_25394/g.34908  ORF Transcript_25394/g.34908 Transcript_25394/m.34908 type:complete len:343 (+) Transcript_25394:452-1480(+)
MVEVHVGLAGDELLNFLPREKLQEAQGYHAPETPTHSRQLAVDLAQPVVFDALRVLMASLVRHQHLGPVRDQLHTAPVGRGRGERDFTAGDGLEVRSTHVRVRECPQVLDEVRVCGLKVTEVDLLADDALPHQPRQTEGQRRLRAQRHPHELPDELEHLYRQGGRVGRVWEVFVHVFVDLVHPVRAQDHEAKLRGMEVRHHLRHRVPVHAPRIDPRFPDELHREDPASRFAETKVGGRAVHGLLESLHEETLRGARGVVPAVLRQGFLLVVQLQRDAPRGVRRGRPERAFEELHLEVIKYTIAQAPELVPDPVLQARTKVDVGHHAAQPLVQPLDKREPDLK